MVGCYEVIFGSLRLKWFLYGVFREEKKYFLVKFKV